MAIDKADAVKHLEHVISLFDDVRADFNNAPVDEYEVLYSLRAAIQRLAPPGSDYTRAQDEIEPDFGVWHECGVLAGAAKALLGDYANDRLQTFKESSNAELFDDFLSMAEFLLEGERLKQPAAVLAGGVLEEHLRKLCDKNHVDSTFRDARGNERKKMLDRLNNDLKGRGVYGKTDHKLITAWCEIRNNAAHMNNEDYIESQVEIMIQGIRSFISRFPA